MNARDSRRHRPRIVDVARVAGVSAQTVSNVMNERDGFSEETRRKVMDAVRQTGYRPNRAAQNLRSRRTGQIAFHLSSTQMDIRNPFTLTLLRHLITEADGRGYRVIVLTDSTSDPRRFQRDAEERDVDGYLLCDCDLGDRRVEVLAEGNVPFALMGRTFPGQPQTWVDLDNRRSMQELVDLVVSKGHREVAYLRYPDNSYWERERQEGVRQGLARHGLTLRSDRVLAGEMDEASGLVRELLTRPDAPTALLTSSDSLAIHAIGVAHALGLRPGEQLAVTGFDDCALERITDPPLTTARIPVADIARCMFDQLVPAMEGERHGTGMMLETSTFHGGSA